MILYYDDKTGYCETDSNSIENLLAECRRDDETLKANSDEIVQTGAGPVRIIAGTMCDCKYKLLEGTKHALEAYDPDSIATLN